ncbi:hypothetical protein B5M42_002220 [Paenibacillus athensensis]|uniref:Uncharacterized protein n=1 Tax=Paenibacillus athensensis TaxID=1967502 RepID=A0A4Y8QAA5_9BACL|nr:hypothetical protein [Paenibacillus athensensis]MCD1257654.1 hypothetical protein [Paenibacillus athensensis]
MLEWLEDQILKVRHWIDSMSEDTKDVILYLLFGYIALMIVFFLFKSTLKTCLKLWKKGRRLFIKTKTGFTILKSFNESGILNNRSLFLFPEGMSDLLSLRKARFLKIGRLLLIPKNLREQWYSGSILLDSIYLSGQKGKNVDQEIKLELKEVLVIPRKITKIIFKLSNIGDSDKTVQLIKPDAKKEENQVDGENFEDGLKKKINRGLKNNIQLFVRDQSVETERIIQVSDVYEYFIKSQESKDIEVIFESLRKSEVKYPCLIILRVKVRSIKDGNVNAKNATLETKIEIPKNVTTPIHEIIEKQVSLIHIFKFLSLGGFFLYGLPVCLLMVFFGVLFHLMLISLLLTIPLLILC